MPLRPQRIYFAYFCPHCDRAEGDMHGVHCRGAGTIVARPDATLPAPEPEGMPTAAMIEAGQNALHAGAPLYNGHTVIRVWRAMQAAEAQSVHQEAARYRWLRDNPSLVKIVGLMARTKPAEWDKTIDREMEAK